MVSECASCQGACCKHISIPFKVENYTAEQLTWFAARGVLQNGNWIIKTRCKHLTPGNLCDIYETRPNACKVFIVGGPDCAQAREFEKDGEEQPKQ